MIELTERLKDAARNMARLAIQQGVLVRQPCESCGATEKIHAHHSDYTRPLDVNWLCAACHVTHHRNLDLLLPDERALRRRARKIEWHERHIAAGKPTMSTCNICREQEKERRRLRVKEIISAGATALLWLSLLFGFNAAFASETADSARVYQTACVVCGKLDFSNSRFGDFPEYEPEPPAAPLQDYPDLEFAEKYIAQANPHVDAHEVALAILDGQFMFPAVPVRLLLPVIKRESNFEITARNRGTNCYGLCQLMHRYHYGPMTAAGLDWYSARDNVFYACYHVQRELDSGKSLYRACRWWEVRPGAWAEYLQLKKESKDNGEIY